MLNLFVSLNEKFKKFSYFKSDKDFSKNVVSAKHTYFSWQVDIYVKILVPKFENLG